MSSALAALLFGAVAPTASAAVLDFEGLGGFSNMPAGYGGFNWGSMWAFDQAFLFDGAASGSGFAVNGPFVPIEHITGPVFDFDGAYLTGYMSGTLLSVSGSANGVTLYSQLVLLDSLPTWFDFDYSNIDTLTLAVVSSSDPWGGLFGIDNFTFNEVVGSIADWTDSTLDLLIGHGGPIGSSVALHENESLAEHNLTIATAGRFTQNGGTHTVNGSMVSQGTYKLNGGSLTVAGDQTISSVGYGYGSSKFEQRGGTNNVAGTLTVGKDAGSSGVYTLHDGALNTKNTVIGDRGTGNLTQNGGTHTVEQTLTLGKGAGGYGSYTLNNGSLVAGDLIVGDAGTGYFDQGGQYYYGYSPSVTVNGTLTLGKQAGSYGSYYLTTGSLSARNVVIGDAGTGYFTQYVATHEIAETLTVGKQLGSYGVYEMVFGELLVGGDEIIGDAGSGHFKQGDVQFGTVYGYSPSHEVKGTLTLGKQATGSGTYDLVRGILTAKNAVLGDAGTGTFHQTGGEFRVAETLTLGKQAGSTGIYKLDEGDLTARDTVVGDGGSGQFVQGSTTYGYRSSNKVEGTLTLGKQAGSSGTYDLVAGTLSAANEVVGDGGVGVFTQTGGTHSVAQTLTVGKQASGDGTFKLSAGSLVATDEIIGDAGKGVFTQGEGNYGYSSSNTVNGTLTLGKQAGSQGIYNLVAGTLSAVNEIVGDSGVGVFNQSGGTHSVDQTLTLGKQAGGDGTFRLSAGSLIAANEVIGDAGSGTFTQGEGKYGYSASNTVNGTLTLGKQAGSQGVYNLLAGALSAQSTVVGDGGTGTFNQLGGNHATRELTLGRQADGVGAYNLTAGELRTDRTVIGDAGYGTFTQSGGLHWATTLVLGQQSGAYGQYTQLGGSMQSFYEVVGDAGTGVYTQLGGVNQVLDLTLGRQAGSSGTYNLRGGELNVVRNIVNGAGQGSLLISGGTLKFDKSALVDGDKHEVDVDTLKVSGQGSIKLAEGVTVTFQKTVEHNGKTIDVAAGANAIFNGTFTGKGPFTGAGTATFNSVLNVGDGPITFNVAGNMVLGEHSKSIMQIGGTARGTGYDAVNVGNALNIDGELNVVGLNGFTGDLGDVFDLYTAETITGKFDLLTLLALGEGLSWKIEYLIDAIGTKDVVRLSVVSSVPLPASIWLLQSALFGLFAARRISRKNR